MAQDPVDCCAYRLFVRLALCEKVPRRENGFTTPFLSKLNNFCEAYPDADNFRFRFVAEGMVIGFTEAVMREKFIEEFSDYPSEDFYGQSVRPLVLNE
jgi:hypothetical protein